jgi:hypothetical protein
MPLGKLQHQAYSTTIQFKGPAKERMKANGRSWLEFSIREGKEMLIASTVLLPVIAMLSISGTRSCST